MRLLLVLLLVAVSQPAFAAAGTSVQVTSSAGGPAELEDDRDFNQAFDPNSASAAAISPHAGSSADGFADFGVLKATAQANSQSGAFDAGGSAVTSWTDILTLSSGAFNGQQARFTSSVTLEGFISPVGTGRGSVQMELRVGNAGILVNGAWDQNTPVNATGFPSAGLNVQPGGTLFYSNIHDFTRTITLGDSFVLSETLTVGAGSKPVCQAPSNPACQNGDSGSVDIDFGHSSYWNGITSIAVLNPGTGLFENQDLSLFNLSAASGIDYFQSFVPSAVPVPAALWMFAPALALVAGRWRRAI